MNDYEVGSPPPGGYISWHRWAEAQYKGGLRQSQCPVCGLWAFPQEMKEHDHRYAPPHHFNLVLGRIGHLSFGKHKITLCGRRIGEHPVVRGLTATDALGRADCKTCKRIVRR